MSAGSGGSEADISGSDSECSAAGAELPQLVDQMYPGGSGVTGTAPNRTRSLGALSLISPRRASILGRVAAAATTGSMAMDHTPAEVSGEDSLSGGGVLANGKGSNRRGRLPNHQSLLPPIAASREGGMLKPGRADRQSPDLPLTAQPVWRSSLPVERGIGLLHIAEPSTPDRDCCEGRSPVRTEGIRGAGHGFTEAELRAYERTNLLLRELHFERLGRLSIQDDDENIAPDQGPGRRSRRR